MIFMFLWIDDNPKRIFNLMEIRVIKMKLIMRKNFSKLYFIDWNIFFLFFICLGYVVTMRSLNGDWQENIPSEESSKNVLSGPFEALNFICLSTPSLDVGKLHYLFDFFSFLLQEFSCYLLYSKEFFFGILMLFFPFLRMFNVTYELSAICIFILPINNYLNSTFFYNFVTLIRVFVCNWSLRLSIASFFHPVWCYLCRIVRAYIISPFI